MAIQVHQATYHRNGSFGAGFYRLTFDLVEGAQHLPMQAIVFDAVEHVAVIDAKGQSWRCEDFEADLRAFIASDRGQTMLWPPAPPRLAANDG